MGDLTFLHYQNPVALIPRFFNFIADHQYRNAMSRQIADNAVYSCFVGDINTDCRAIENQQSWRSILAARYHQKAYSPEDEDQRL